MGVTNDIYCKLRRVIDILSQVNSNIEDLGWNRKGFYPSEMMDVMEDHEVWRLNLEQLPPQPSRKSGQ